MKGTFSRLKTAKLSIIYNKGTLRTRARICKNFEEPRNRFRQPICSTPGTGPPDYIGWRNQFLGSLKFLKFGFRKKTVSWCRSDIQNRDKTVGEKVCKKSVKRHVCWLITIDHQIFNEVDRQVTLILRALFKNKSSMERRDLTKVISILNWRSRDWHVPAGNRTRASTVGGEHSRKEPFEYGSIFDCYSENGWVT